MKTTIKGNYSFRRPSKRKGSNALAIIGFILILISFIARTQFFAWDVGKNKLMRLPGPVKDVNQNIVEPGDMLIFSAGFPPIYGKQILYFLDKVFSERSKIDAPEKSDIIEQKAA